MHSVRIVFIADLRSTCGFYSPDPQGLSALVLALPINSPAHQVMSRLTSSNEEDMKLYRIVSVAERDAMEASVLAPLRTAHQLRVPPYHQYTLPSNSLNLQMPHIGSFRNGMFTQPGQTQPPLQIPDTHGRTSARPLSILSFVGVIREEQSHDELCDVFREESHTIRMVKGPYPILGAGAVLMPAGTVQQPNDRHLYLGFVSIGPNTLQAPYRLTRRETLCMLQHLTNGPQLVSNGEKSIGMVLEVSDNTLATTGAHLVLALYLEKKVKESTVRDLTQAVVEHVNISFRPSSKQA